MNKILTSLIISLTLNFAAANNFLVSYEKKATFTKEELKDKWKENKIKEFISPVKYSVDVYEIIYKSR